jgi:leukotriene-A4 hydrolase
VTNATWADSWLNEGFTNLFRNRIMEAIYGKERAHSRRRRWASTMMEALDEEGMSNPDTRLNLAAGRKPVRRRR